MCASAETLAELANVLGRAKFDRYADVSQRQAFIAGYRAHAYLFEVTSTISDCPDPQDNMFLALAEMAGAELISDQSERTTPHGYAPLARDSDTPARGIPHWSRLIDWADA